MITNDDGIDAAGIRAIVDSLKDELDLFVVAPMKERSGAGHSITLGKDIHLKEVADHEFAFDGTPVDCVTFALRNLVRDKPELCISGINLGANLGNDTLCSGTVGAALAAANEGIPGIAISMVGARGPYHLDTAVHVLKSLLRNKLRFLIACIIEGLNVNVPNVPLSELRGESKCANSENAFGARSLLQEKLPDSFRYCHEEPINFGGSNFDVTEGENGFFATVTVLQPSLFDSHSNDILEDITQGMWDDEFFSKFLCLFALTFLGGCITMDKQTPPSIRFTYHRVKANETLKSIAKKYYIPLAGGLGS